MPLGRCIRTRLIVSVALAGSGVAFMLGTVASGTTAASATQPSSARRSAPPQCTPSQVHIQASTSHGAYPPGQTVTMTSSIKNVSDTTCTIYLGADPGFSPSFAVTNNHGTLVWDRCWLNDEPGACATVLRAHSLRPGRRFQQRATWDQRSGPDGGPVVQVPPGEYTFTTHYQYIGTASTTFDILVG